jgi:hypothetical protein
VALSTAFYLELQKSGATTTLKLYSDAYTTLVDTLSITPTANPAFRYAIVPAKAPSGSGATAGGTIQNVDLSPSAPASGLLRRRRN